MKADTDSTVQEPVRLAFADVPQRRAVVPIDQSAIENPKSKMHENLYLAMVAEGKLKPFASTAMATQGTGVPKVSSESDNRKSKIQNPKSKGLAPASDSSPQHSALSSQSLSAADLDPIYTYDLNGNRTSMIDPTGLTTYTYDALNRLTSITNNKGQVTSFTYDALAARGESRAQAGGRRWREIDMLGVSY